MHFGKNLEFLRKREGKILKEMLDFIGIKGTTWSGYENEKSFPNFHEFLRISEKFGISETDLIHADLSNSAEKPKLVLTEHKPKYGLTWEKKYEELEKEYQALKDKYIKCLESKQEIA